MKAHITYLKYILRHKWFVFLACCKLGIPWLGIVHDLSKFSRAEWRPYVLSFYSGREKNERPQWVVRLFERALQHHYDYNPHHPEHWHIGGGVFPMPDRYRREMLADWIGAGRAKKKGDPYHEGINEVAIWYAKHKDKIYLHPSTCLWVEKQLDIISAGEGK